MNPRQVEYFRLKLMKMRADLLRELQANPPASAEESVREGDRTDQASAETERELGAIHRERAQSMLYRVDQALSRVESGDYGYCEDSGEPIGLKRLEAQPMARLSVAAQERRERARG